MDKQPTNMSDNFTDRVKSRFSDVSHEFFNQTQGVINIAHGEDTITQTAAKSFLPDALLALREQGINTFPDKKSTILAEIVVEAFMRNLQTDQQNYVLTHKPDYIHGLHVALNKPEPARGYKVGVIIDPRLML